MRDAPATVVLRPPWHNFAFELTWTRRSLGQGIGRWMLAIEVNFTMPFIVDVESAGAMKEVDAIMEAIDAC